MTADQLTEIYAAYSLRVYRFMRYRLPSSHDAEDLTSAVFERVLRKHDTFEPAKASFDVWLFTIARNLLKDHYRRAAVRRIIHLGAADARIEPDGNPEQYALKNEDFQMLRAALRVLKPRELTIISLRYGSALRNIDIAQVLHLTEKNTGVILSRALKKLRAEMRKGDPQ